MRRKPPQLDKPYPRHRPVSEEEAELWREVVESGKEGELKKKEELKKERELEKAGELKKKKSRKSADSPVRQPSHSSSPLSSLDRPTLASLKRGTFSREARLDLHFMTQQEAYEALLHFITHARERNLRVVIVITGKGRAGGGALRAMLPLWLEQPPLREYVSAYHPAGPRHGGEGAWYVRLKRVKSE